MTAYRFCYLGNAPFTNDEPRTQLFIDEHLIRGTIPLHGLWGSRALCGPAPAWMFMLLRLFTAKTDAIVLFHAFLFTVGIALALLTIWNHFGPRSVLWLWALIASSPVLFFYSRFPWDNTFQIFFGGVLIFWLSSLFDRKPTLVDGIGTGILAGLLLNTHLMSIPFLVAIALTRTKEMKQRRFWITQVLGFSAVAAPYLVVLIPTLRGDEYRVNILSILYELIGVGFGPVRLLMLSTMEYFFDGQLPWVPSLRWIDITVGLLMVFPFLGWRPVRSSVHYSKAPLENGRDFLTRLALTQWVVTALYYALIGLSLRHPHYILPLLWPLLILLALLLSGKKTWRVWWWYAVIGVIVVINTVFTLLSQEWIMVHQGTQGRHFGTTIDEQKRVIGELCVAAADGLDGSAAQIPLDISGVPSINEAPLLYHFNHDLRCKSRQLVFGRGGGPWFTTKTLLGGQIAPQATSCDAGWLTLIHSI